MNSETVHLIFSNGETKEIPLKDVLNELYYNLGKIDKSKYSDKEFSKIKILISSDEDFIPLYDIFSKNFYIINSNNVFSRVTKYHYRIPTESTLKKLVKTLKDLPDNLSSYKEKIEKNITFIKNFDFKTLEKSYYKKFYLSQPKIQEITTCLKPSFVPFMTKKPYYTKSELINMALNLDLPLTYDDDELCKLISTNDVSSKIILTHQIYIKKTSKSYVQLYTLLGSYYWNYYIRNEPYKDLHTETQILRLYNIIRSAPAFDKSYYFFRFIDNDDYLKHLSPGDIFMDYSFISTTRNPFYDTKNNFFGFILIKILIPKNVEGLGLCVESYSLFSNEEEILLGPSKLKLVSIDSNFKYYHPDKKAGNRINKLYTFEFVDKLEIKNFDRYAESQSIIPEIDFSDSAKGDDFTSKVYHFHKHILPPFNNKRYFKSKIGNETFLFHVFYLDNNPIYEKYFFLQNSNNNSNHDEVYFMVHDEITGEIILLIELRDIISVNYIHRYIGTPEKKFNDEDIIMFISKLAHYFSVNQVILHDEYESYLKISNNILEKHTEEVFDQDNPDNHVISLFSGDFRYYNVNIINQLEKKEKRFSHIPGVTYNLKPSHFRRYLTIDSMTLFNGVAKTPLYNVLIKLNKQNKITNVLDFYLYIHNNYFYMMKELETLIINYDKEFFNTELIPLKDSYAILNSEEYLYERKLISSIGTFPNDLYKNYLKKLSEENKNISFNKFRFGMIK